MAKKMKIKVDWKQLFVQKGERIALGVAAVLCVLMLVPMFWFLLFGQNSKSVAEELTKPADQLKDRQARAEPTPTDKPPATGKEAVVLSRPKVDATQYPFAPLFTQTTVTDATKRQMPKIQLPVEARVAVAQAQLKRYIIFGDGDKEKIMKLVGADGAPMGSGSLSADYKKQMQQAYGNKGPGGMPPGMGPGNMNPGGRSRYGNPSGYGQVGVENNKKELKMEPILLTEIGDTQTERLADTVEPVRMAIIAVSFPYRRQIQEFQDKLHLKTMKEVVDEVVMDPTDIAAKEQKHTFNFLSPVVERRQVDAFGRPFKINDQVVGWETLDLEASYLDLVRVNGGRFEQEPPALDAVSFEGLVMPKLAVMGKNQYPPVEGTLTTLQSTLTALAKKDAPPVITPKNPLRRDGFKVFSKQSPADQYPMGPGMTMGPGTTTGPGTSFKPPPGMGPGSPGMLDPNNKDAYPEYCLIRLIDTTVKPGMFYQYRMKVRMANPNQGQPNVASPAYATRTEPLESDWFEIAAKKDAPAHVVAVPSEYHMYAVDQKVIDITDSPDHKYTGQAARVDPVKDRQSVFQIHKWLERADIDSRTSVPVGEWSVAERIFVYRGELIGRRQRVEVPYWRPTQENFVLAYDKAKKTSGLEVDFGPPEGDDPILVDFEGGEVPISRVTGKKDGKDEVYKATDRSGYETLILSPDGKLVAHNSWTDKTDKERTERLKAWHERIKEVKEGKDKGGSDTPKQP